MKHVRLTIRAPEGAVHPVFDVLTRAEHVDRVAGLHWNFSGDRLGILHHVEGDLESYVAEIEGISSVLDYDVARVDDGTFYVYHQCVVHGVANELFETFTRGSLLVVPPLEFGSDGTSRFSVFGEATEIQAAIEGVPDPIDVTVDEVGSMTSTPDVAEATLSERQRQAIDTAFALGYYDVPRDADHAAVAEAMDCAPSTGAEHLRKAEAKLLGSVLRR